MIRNAQSDRAAPFVLQAPRRFPGSLEKESVWSGRMGAQQPVLPVLQKRVLAHFREIPAHESEMMMPIGLADGADALERRLIANVTAERVTRIGWIDDHPAISQALGSLANEALLRRHRMKLQVDAHGSKV